MSHRSNRTVALTTLGCKVNQADSDEWVRQFSARGYEIVNFDETADAYVVNTCTVTHVADRKSRQLLRQARRQNPAALVVASGCYASVAPEALARLVEVDLIVRDADKPRLVDLIHERLEGAEEQPHEVLADGIRVFGARHRGFVKIGDGCDKFCAFCIVPYARGRARSSAPDDVIARVKALEDAGAREVVLTAVHMGTYGRDLAPATSLRALVERVLRETSVERVRLSSIEPEDFDPAVLDLWDNQRLCRHFHLALDSGCDATLRRMRRRYTNAEYRSIVNQIRRAIPGVAITTDVMVGFPGETDEEFAESAAYAREVGFAGIHVFPYSSRPRTSASKLPGHLDPGVKRERTEAMLAIAAESAERFRRARLGETLPVLYENLRRRDDGIEVWEGLTDNYIRVQAVSDGDLTNQIVPTRLEQLRGDAIEGTVPGDLVVPVSPAQRPLRTIPLTAVSR